MRIADKLRAVLEERIALMAPARRLRLAAAGEILASEAGSRPIRVLDAGCGDGLLTLALAARHPEWAFVGVDRREDLLAGARERARGRSLGNVQFEVADLTRPLPEADFDAVLSLETLEEIPNDRAALAAMADALAPGGLLVVEVPERDWKPVLPGSPATWREEVRHGYGAEEIAGELADAGLAEIETRPAYRSLAAAAQEVRDRIKNRSLPLRLAAFPLVVAAARLEGHGLTWGPANAILASARRPLHRA